MKKRLPWGNSIRAQLAAVFVLLLLAVILVIIFMNTIFLERYYNSNKKTQIINSYYSIDALSEKSGAETEAFKNGVDSLTADSRLLVVIVDPGMNIIYSTEREPEMIAARLLWRMISGDPGYEPGNDTGSGGSKRKDIEVLGSNESYNITTSTDPAMKSDYIELWGYMTNGDLIFIRTPLESIRESAEISTRFMLYIGILIALVGAVGMWFVTKRITEPILELTDISDRMAHLDFDARYESSVTNEIGELGRHMNEMSSQLESAISELKSANAELQQDIEKKEKIESMRSEFISNVSHELKTPIALISGYAEGLRDGVADDEESRNEYLDVIIDESEKMGKLVSGLLELNHIEFGNDPAHMERFDITALIGGAIAGAEILARRFGADIRFEASKPVYVWSDEARTETVFNNYLTNAIHYAGGEKLIDITVAEKDGNVRIEVHNTGEGIPEESIERIWEKFYKVDKARTREVGGSGMGLSIVKAIMETLNKPCGVINYNDGVTFWFELEGADK